VLLMVLLKYKG